VGWNCSVNVYLPPARIAAALEATAHVADLSHSFPCEVVLPHGHLLHLPFGRMQPSDPAVVKRGREPGRFDLVLKVPTDEVTDEWWDEVPNLEEGGQYIGLGWISLSVGIGERYAEMMFFGPSGAVSSILYESPSAHRRLLGVLQEAGGLAGAIVSDTVVEVRDLASPHRTLTIDWDWVRADKEAHFLDRFAESVVSQCARRQ
jgi:hypothetical protein